MDLPPDAVGLIMGLSILIGAVQCFTGYRIFKFVVGLAGWKGGRCHANSKSRMPKMPMISVMMVGRR